jgi:hypothetical protein
MIANLLALALAGAVGQTPGCRHIGGSLTYVRFSRDVVRPGDVVTMQPSYRDGPDGEKETPRRCVTRVKVSGAGRLARDGTIHVDPDAPAGAIIRVSMRIGDARVETGITVVGTNQQVLAGTWHPVSQENCYGRPLGELVLTSDGRYIFTFAEQMIETMTSGSGTYRWEPVSGRIELDGTRTATAHLDGNGLTLEGLSFEGFAPVMEPGAPPLPPCRIVLR